MRKQKELDANVKQPALAERYKKEQLALGHATKVNNEAEAEAMALKLKGEAEAAAISAKAKAEAEQMALKAKAWQQYQDAALVDMVLEALPQMVAEIATPLTQGTKGIKLVSTGSDAQIGASKLTGEILDIVERLPVVVNNMSGVDLSKVTKSSFCYCTMFSKRKAVSMCNFDPNVLISLPCKLKSPLAMLMRVPFF